VSSPLGAQVAEMARRSITQTLRQPAQIVPPMTFPLLLLAVNVGGLDAATQLPGFRLTPTWTSRSPSRSSSTRSSR
jgi:hypothetical protein